MKIVINSHNKSSIALDHLLKSMKEQPEYDEFEIIVAIGGYYEIATYELHTVENITYIHCNHNSIDFTGLITLMELYRDNTNEHYLYLHDTCRVGSNFYKKLKAIQLNVSSIKLNREFSMNMGVYSQSLINRFTDFLLSKKNTDESKCIQFKSINYSEDYLFLNDHTNTVLDNYSGWEYTGPVDYYNTGTMRIVEYYPNLDLYKIKANWGQGDWTLAN